MPTLLPDLADLGEVLDLLPSGVDENRVQALLTQASNRFRGDVRHPVSHVEGDEVWLDGDGTATLLLPAAPVTAVDLVEIDGTAATGWEWSETGVLRRRAGWPDRLRSVRVIYDHGYREIPGDIQEAVIERVRFAYRAEPGISSMQVGGQSISWAASAVAGVTDNWLTAVETYRLNRGDRT